MIEILKTICEVDGEEQLYSVRILHEFGKGDGYLNPRKISEMWAAVKDHKVLFSDQTFGQAELFLAVLFDPASVWLDVVIEGSQEISVGVIHLTNVIPGFDAKGHFWVLDGKAAARKQVFIEAMGWIFNRYGLNRISAEVPPYQRGVLRFAEKHLGFTKEGERRGAVKYEGQWWPLIEFGVLKSEYESLFVSRGVQLLNKEPEVQDG